MRKVTSGDKKMFRFILIISAISLSLLGDSLLYAVLSVRPEDFGILIWQIGILLAVNRLVRILTNELAGRIVDKLDIEKPLFIAVIVGGLITASYTLPWGFWPLFAARIAWGACWSVLRVEGYLAALNISTEKNRGKIFGLFQAIIRIGYGGGILVGGILCDLIDIRPTFFIFSIISISGVLLLAKASSLSLCSSKKSFKQLANSTDANGNKTHNRFLLNPEILFLWLSAFSITLTDQMIYNLTGRLVAERIGSGIPIVLGLTSITGILLSFRSIVSLIIGPLSGSLSDRIGRPKIILFGCIIQIISISLLALSTYWLILILVIPIQFSAAVAARIGITTLAGDKAPEVNTALFMNRYSTFMDLGNAFGSLIAFSVYASFGFTWIAIINVCILIFAIVANIRGF